MAETEQDDRQREDTQPEKGRNGWMIAARIVWLAIRIVAVAWVGQQGAHFLYQGF